MYYRYFLFFVFLGLSHTIIAQENRSVGFFRIRYILQDSAIVRQAVDSLTADLLLIEKFFRYSLQDTIEIIFLPTKEFRNIQSDWHIPDWGVALAVPDKKQIWMTTAFRPSLAIVPENPRTIIRHELAHVILHLKANGKRLPVWFNEGSAVKASGENRSLDMLKRAAITRTIIPFDDLEAVLRYDPYKAELAYDQSLSAVLLLTERFGKNVIPDIIDSLKNDRSFADAFISVTGISVYRFEKEWEERLYPVPIIQWTRYAETFLWIALIPSLFVLAWLAIKRRQRLKKREWEMEGDRDANFMDSE